MVDRKLMNPPARRNNFNIKTALVRLFLDVPEGQL
jgi:hypothetical protein